MYISLHYIQKGVLSYKYKYFFSIQVSTFGRVSPVHGYVHMIPGVEQVAPGVAQVARGLAQLAPGASRVATGLAQFAPGVVGNTYANFYRNLLSYYQSHYANRNQQFGYPLMHNQNVGKGVLLIFIMSITTNFRRRRSTININQPNIATSIRTGITKTNIQAIIRKERTKSLTNIRQMINILKILFTNLDTITTNIRKITTMTLPTTSTLQNTQVI